MAQEKASTGNNDTLILVGLLGLGAGFLYLLTGKTKCSEGSTRMHTCPEGNTILQTCISGVYLPECQTSGSSAEIVSFTIT